MGQIPLLFLYSTTFIFHHMLSENLQTPVEEKSGNFQPEPSECEYVHKLKISLMLFHKHLPYIHVTGFTNPDTVKNWQNYPHQQEENSHTNEKREYMLILY